MSTLTLTTHTDRNDQSHLHYSMWIGQQLSRTKLSFWTFQCCPQQTSRYQRRSCCPRATSWDKHWSRQTTQRGRSQEGNQAILSCNSPRRRCHPCRSLQAWWWRAATEDDRPFLPYVGRGSDISAAQICVHHPPTKKGKSPALWYLTYLT